jgi:CxxC-x17-CxxC domain-containing protein
MNDFKRNDRFGGKRSGGGFGKKDFGGGRPSFGGQRSDRAFGGRSQTEMFDAICAQCNKDCQVPFRPNGQRPVYCRDCFGSANSSGPSRDSRDSREFKPRAEFRESAPTPVKPQAPDPRIDDLMRKLDKILSKLDQIMLASSIAKAYAKDETHAAAAEAPVVKKKKKTAKKK